MKQAAIAARNKRERHIGKEIARWHDGEWHDNVVAPHGAHPAHTPHDGNPPDRGAHRHPAGENGQQTAGAIPQPQRRNGTRRTKSHSAATASAADESAHRRSRTTQRRSAHGRPIATPKRPSGCSPKSANDSRRRQRPRKGRSASSWPTRAALSKRPARNSNGSPKPDLRKREAQRTLLAPADTRPERRAHDAPISRLPLRRQVPPPRPPRRQQHRNHVPARLSRR